MQRKTLRVLTYNVHSCVGTDRKLDPARIADVIASCEPDIVGLQELDVGRQRTGAVDQADTIASFLKMKALFHPAVHKAEEKYGDAILTALPMRTCKTGGLPSIGEPRGAAWTEILVDGTPIHVFNTHLGLRRRERMAQVAALLGTFPSRYPMLRLDHIFVAGGLTAVNAHVVSTPLSRMASDHLPVVAEIELTWTT